MAPQLLKIIEEEIKNIFCDDEISPLSSDVPFFAQTIESICLLYEEKEAKSFHYLHNSSFLKRDILQSSRCLSFSFVFNLHYTLQVSTSTASKAKKCKLKLLKKFF
jgi:hypothetical protein